jgi:hypothetical protein
MKFKDGARVPKRVTRQLANIGRLIDIPRIGIAAEVNGRKTEMSLVFQIHPLIADYDEKKAYHPLTVGLFFAPEVSGKNIITRTPAAWPKKDRKVLWKELLQAVDKTMARLVPKTESEDSIILSVNAQLKVPPNWWRPENRSAEITKITDGLSQAGELEKIDVGTAASGPEKRDDDTCRVCGWIHDPGFTQIKMDDSEAISLGGRLPEIFGLVHKAHEKGPTALSTKDEALVKTCGGYRNPCKAFDDLKHRNEYHRLFDTRSRGFISLRGAAGRNRNKSERSPE